MTDSIVRTMSSQVAARVRDKILAGAYEPGQALLQDSIAAEFGVSKIPVREALVHLRSEGLVDIFAHRGFQVRRLSASEAEEVFRLRIQLEPGAVMAGAKAANPEERLAADRALNALNSALGEHRLASIGDLNAAFHLSLIVPRLQPVTFEILGRLHTLSQRYVQMHLLPTGRIRRAIREHVALHREWAAGRVREAGRLARMHIEETRDELTRSLSRP
jgi:DNA-binding GntR family transcriptional regulator